MTIATRASMCRPDKRSAVTPSSTTRKPHRDGPAGWRHGSIDEGERLEAAAVASAAHLIRVAVLAGDWSGAVGAMLGARGEQVNAKGLQIAPNERGPALTDVEADYVVALSECHLTRTDLVVGAQELCRLSWWTKDLSYAAEYRWRWVNEPKLGATSGMSMAERRATERSARAKYFRNRENEVA